MEHRWGTPASLAYIRGKQESAAARTNPETKREAEASADNGATLGIASRKSLCKLVYGF